MLCDFSFCISPKTPLGGVITMRRILFISLTENLGLLGILKTKTTRSYLTFRNYPVNLIILLCWSAPSVGVVCCKVKVSIRPLHYFSYPTKPDGRGTPTEQ